MIFVPPILVRQKMHFVSLNPIQSNVAPNVRQVFVMSCLVLRTKRTRSEPRKKHLFIYLLLFFNWFCVQSSSKHSMTPSGIWFHFRASMMHHSASVLSGL